MKATLTILGTGTSHGVPMIGCSCQTCTSQDHRDVRTNASALLQTEAHTILIDCGRDFRSQALTNEITNIDSVILTHNHYDHIAGIDDLRVFTGHDRDPMPLYGKREHLDYITNHSFRYLFDGEVKRGGGVAALAPHAVTETFTVCGVEFLPLPVWHGRAEIYGYRFKNCAYIPDVSEIPETTLDHLVDLQLLVVGGLRYRPHVSHFSIAESLQVIEKIQPQQALLTHMCHDVLHVDLLSKLGHEPLACNVPVRPAFDGERVHLADEG